MSAMASLIISVSIVCSTVCAGADERKQKRSALMAFVRGLHRRPINSPHRGASNAENVSIWWCYYGPPQRVGHFVQAQCVNKRCCTLGINKGVYLTPVFNMYVLMIYCSNTHTMDQCVTSLYRSMLAWRYCLVHVWGWQPVVTEKHLLTG